MDYNAGNQDFVVWFVMTSSYVAAYQYFGEPCLLYLQGHRLRNLEDGGGLAIRDVGILPQNTEGHDFNLHHSGNIKSYKAVISVDGLQRHISTDGL
jgi:hypothetical protein